MSTGWPHIFATQYPTIALQYLDDQFNTLSAASTATTSVSGAGLVGFQNTGGSGIQETVEAALRNYQANAKSYGLKIDGSTDDTTNLQTLIDNMSAGKGGAIVFPPSTTASIVQNIVLKTGVYLYGVPVISISGNGTIPATLKMKTGSTGYVLDTPVGILYNCGVQGFLLAGLGAGQNGGGLNLRNMRRFVASDLFFDEFDNQALVIGSSSQAGLFRRLVAQNSVLNHTQTGKIGAFDVGGTDHDFWACELTTSLASATSSNLYVVAWNISGTNNTFSQCIGEISDEGFYVSGNYNKFSICRADLNEGHGWEINGGSNLFATCHSHQNSQDTDNTYDGWRWTSLSASNVDVGCSATYNGVGNKCKYLFNDLLVSDNNKNLHVGNGYSANTYGTAAFNSSQVSGAGFVFGSGGAKSFTVNTTAPDVTGFGNFKTANTASTGITNFSGGTQGQLVRVRAADSFTYFINGGNMHNTSGATITASSGIIYQYQLDGTTWYQI